MTSRSREVVLDTRALSALLDERKPDHPDAQRALEPFDEAMADRAAAEWVTRTRAGRTPGELDLLIASTAAVLGADVVTADVGFPEPDGVRLLQWAELAAG